MTLLEAARKYGVETHNYTPGFEGNLAYRTTPRPDLDIAHDILAKLPDHLMLKWLERDQWYWEEDHGHCGKCGQHINLTEQGTFIEAILALAERDKGNTMTRDDA